MTEDPQKYWALLWSFLNDKKFIVSLLTRQTDFVIRTDHRQCNYVKCTYETSGDFSWCNTSMRLHVCGPGYTAFRSDPSKEKGSENVVCTLCGKVIESGYIDNRVTRWTYDGGVYINDPDYFVTIQKEQKEQRKRNKQQQQQQQQHIELPAQKKHKIATVTQVDTGPVFVLPPEEIAAAYFAISVVVKSLCSYKDPDHDKEVHTGVCRIVAYIYRLYEHYQAVKNRYKCSPKPCDLAIFTMRCCFHLGGVLNTTQYKGSDKIQIKSGTHPLPLDPFMSDILLNMENMDQVSTSVLSTVHAERHSMNVSYVSAEDMRVTCSASQKQRLRKIPDKLTKATQRFENLKVINHHISRADNILREILAPENISLNVARIFGNPNLTDIEQQRLEFLKI